MGVCDISGACGFECRPRCGLALLTLATVCALLFVPSSWSTGWCNQGAQLETVMRSWGIGALFEVKENPDFTWSPNRPSLVSRCLLPLAHQAMASNPHPRTYTRNHIQLLMHTRVWVWVHVQTQTRSNVCKCCAKTKIIHTRSHSRARAYILAHINTHAHPSPSHTHAHPQVHVRAPAHDSFHQIDCASKQGESLLAELFGRGSKEGLLYWVGDGAVMLKNIHKVRAGEDAIPLCESI